MIKRRTIGLAAATAVLGGLGAYGATAAFAATEPPAPKPTTTQSESGKGGTDEMIRHCTDHLPADERAKARQQMEKMMSTMPSDMTSMMPKDMKGMKGMMSGAEGAMGSMMGGASHGEHHGMG